MALIYGLYDPRDPIEFIYCRYVGQTERTSSKRLSEHIMEARAHKSPRRIFKWIRSLLRESVEPIIVVLEEVDHSDVEDEVRFQLIDDAEITWIAIGHKVGARLTNHNDGGRGNRGYVPTEEDIRKGVEARRGFKHSDETRQRMSESAKDKPKSIEHRAAISATLTGRPQTPEQLAAAATRRGVPLSEETKAKQSASLKANPKMRELWESRKGQKLSDETRAKISLSNTANPGTIAASLKGGNAFKEKFESNPEFADAWRQTNGAASLIGKKKMFKKRVRCDECGFISNPQGIGHHQTSFGHTGKTMLEPIEESPEPLSN